MMQDNSQDSLSAALKPAAPERGSFRPQIALLISVLAVLVAVGFGIYQFRTLQNFKAEIGRSDKVKLDLQALQQDEANREQRLEARFALIEARQAEEQSQQAALSTMYDALTRNDTVRVLTEIEQTLTFASQQLQLTGNIPAAQAALTGIDQKLAQLNRPELIRLRQALAKDIDTLKALPTFDLSGITLKLDNLAGSLNKLPLAIDGFRGTPVAPPKTEGDQLTRFATELWHEMKQLIQIRRMDRPDAMLLSPEQAFFVRENIKLRLMDARTALLLRDEATYRADLKAVLSYLHQHFDTRAPQTASTTNLLEQLVNQPLALKLPDLGGSLAAARIVRSVAERAKP
ncbi:MAG: uroporphyrinogen-III C-methyltransferase [Formivibrio sp.]|nr:uroporphyrinogen-III C-methyltransferase [Formivibrio sp.]